MNLSIFTFLLLSISATAQDCGSRSPLKACTCKDKVGYIYSPVVTGLRDCEWQIYAEKTNHVVLLESVFVNIHSNGNCSSGYLEVFDGADRTSPSLGRWCKGGISVESSGRDMLVTYRTDDVITAPNTFELTYKAKKPTSNIGTILAITLPVSFILFGIVVFVVAVACGKGSTGTGRSRGGGGYSGGGFGGGDGGGGGGGGGGGC